MQQKLRWHDQIQKMLYLEKFFLIINVSKNGHQVKLVGHGHFYVTPNNEKKNPLVLFMLI